MKCINYEADLRKFKSRKRVYGNVAPKAALIRPNACGSLGDLILRVLVYIVAIFIWACLVLCLF